MEINEYFQKMREINNRFLEYLDDDDPDSTHLYKQLILVIDSFNFCKNLEELQIFLFFIIKIANNHHRKPNFYKKIEQILNYLKTDINNLFPSQVGIFNFFKSNNRLLLYFIKSKMITLNDEINHQVSQYFSPEIGLNDQEDIEKFEENRQEGENETYISSLIRNDSIVEFVQYINQENISLKTKTIKPSIFETNLFLINKTPTLIEYASFFGSLQIIRYLHLNGIELDSSLWLYSIHSNNSELIQFLEENHVEFETDILLKKCFEEAIKCHHNDLARYIADNFLNESNEINLHFCFQNYNFENLDDDDLNPNDIIFYLCQYNYKKAVEILLKDKGMNICIRKIFNFHLSKIELYKKTLFLYNFKNFFVLKWNFKYKDFE